MKEQTKELHAIRDEDIPAIRDALEQVFWKLGPDTGYWGDGSGETLERRGLEDRELASLCEWAIIDFQVSTNREWPLYESLSAETAAEWVLEIILEHAPHVMKAGSSARRERKLIFGF